MTMQRPDPIRYWQGQSRHMPHRGIRDPSTAVNIKRLLARARLPFRSPRPSIIDDDKELGGFFGLIMKFVYPMGRVE